MAIMTEPVSGQAVTLAGLGGVEAVLLAGIVVGPPSQALLLGLDKAATTKVGNIFETLDPLISSSLICIEQTISAF